MKFNITSITTQIVSEKRKREKKLKEKFCHSRQIESKLWCFNAREPGEGGREGFNFIFQFAIR